MPEVLVALMLLAVAAGGIFAGYKGGLTGWITAQQFTGEQQNARMVLDWTVRRLRMLGNEYAGAEPALKIAEANRIVFYGNTDRDPAVECQLIYLSNGIVYAQEAEWPIDCNGGVGQPISASAEAKNLSVTLLTFQYFDSAGVELAGVPLSVVDRAKVRRVQITVGTQGFQYSATPYVMSTQVSIR